MAPTRRALYCSLRCHDEAKTVRYARKKHEQHGIDLPSDISNAIRIRMAHVLSGGYDAAARRLTPEVYRAVWERDGGRCVLCQAPGQDVDHIDGPSSELSNLRLLCKACHNDVTLAHLHPTDDPVVIARAAALRQRVDAPEPLLPCDAAGWSRQWRQWVKDHVVETDHADLPSKIQTPPG